MKVQTAPIRIFIADDFELFRTTYRSLIEDQPGMQVIGQAENGSDLLRQIQFNTPDIILCDIRMPSMDGFEATRFITKNYPKVSVIAFSIYNDDYTIMEMLAAGAAGFILKDITKNELNEAINTVYNNGTYYCPSTRAKLSHLITTGVFDPVTKEFCIQLTLREKQVLRLICKEMSNNEISVLLGISVRTVEKFRSKIFLKTGAKNLAGVVVFAIKYGIYIPDVRSN